METSILMQVILSGIFACVGIALIITLIFVMRFVNQAQKTSKNLEEALMPSLANIEAITNDIKPLVSKTEPLLDRAHLTFDAVNLELMRLDQILEDASEISKTAARATNTLEAATQAPLTIVNSLSDKIKDLLTPAASSKEAQELASQNMRSNDDETVSNWGANAQSVQQESMFSQEPSSQEPRLANATSADEDEYFTYKQ